MKRVASMLLACAAACSIYGSEDDTPPATTPPAIDPTFDGGDAASLGETDLTNDPLHDEDGGTEPDAKSSNDATPDTSGPLPDLLVFITSDTHPGKLDFAGSETAGDKICQELALVYAPKKFKAWLSGPGGSVKDRIINHVIGRTYRRLDHALVIDKAEKMVDGALSAPISLDEKGNAWSNTTSVWTGTTLGGEGSAADCLGWFTSDPSASGMAAVVTAGAVWGNGAGASCDQPRHLYCFEVP